MRAQKDQLNKEYTFIDNTLKKLLFSDIEFCNESKSNISEYFNSKLSSLLLPITRSAINYNSYSKIEQENVWNTIEKSIQQNIESIRQAYQRIKSNFKEVHSIQISTGETHNLGKQVIFFESKNKKYVYKPVNGYGHQFIYNISRYICKNLKVKEDIIQKIFYTGQNYSIYHFIENDQLSTGSSSDYSYSSGILTCLSFYLKIIDMHDENVITSKNSPVLIDLECFFYQCFYQNPLDVFDNGLIRKFKSGLDINVITENKEDFYLGFSDCYDFLINEKQKILKEISLIDIKTQSRCIIRPTRYYENIITRSLVPYNTNEEKMNTLLEKMIIDMGYSQINQNHISAISNYEINDIFRTDVPYFHTKISSKSLFCRQEIVCKDFFKLTPRDYIINSINNLSKEDKEINVKMLQKYLGI